MRSYAMLLEEGDLRLTVHAVLDMVFSNDRKEFRNFALLLQEHGSHLQPVPNAQIVRICK
jgi:hypothetical protein